MNAEGSGLRFPRIRLPRDHAATFDGARYDCGSKTGFVEATLALAMARADMGEEVRAIARRLLDG